MLTKVSHDITLSIVEATPGHQSVDLHNSICCLVEVITVIVSQRSPETTIKVRLIHKLFLYVLAKTTKLISLRHFFQFPDCDQRWNQRKYPTVLIIREKKPFGRSETSMHSLKTPKLMVVSFRPQNVPFESRDEVRHKRQKVTFDPVKILKFRFEKISKNALNEFWGHGLTYVRQSPL